MNEVNNYTCDMCGVDMYLRPCYINNGQRHYCSKECKGKGQTLYHSGKNHHGYSQQIVKCDWCGVETSKSLNVLKKNKNNFCSVECSREFFANVTSQTNETRERTRKVTLNNLKNGAIKTDTSIQLKINNLLTNNNINFVNEYIIGKHYSVDNYLNEYGLIIENQGDYWHTNPNVFPDIRYDAQLRGIRSDKRKSTYIKKYHKVNILYLWETDINNNIELCEQLILKYIKNKGILENYESFNYILVDGILTLNESIIKPYREYSKEDIDIITDLSVKQKPEYYITFNCEVCGSEKVQKKCVYEKHKHHYCSRVCAVRGRTMFNESTVIKFNCDNCGVQCEQPRAQYNANKTHFCSPACRGIYVKTTTLVNCDNCNNEIEITAKQKRLYNHHFCNNSCRIQFNQKQR